MLIPSVETQSNFNNSFKNTFTLSFDSWTTDRRVFDTQVEDQFDIECAHKIKSPKYLIAAHQTADGSAPPNKANNTAIFDNLDVRKYLVELDGIRHPRDSVNLVYKTNNYLDQCRDLELFYKEDVGEPLLSPFITYTDMKNFYPIHVIDLRYQVDHITAKKFNCLRSIEVLLMKLDCL